MSDLFNLFLDAVGALMALLLLLMLVVVLYSACNDEPKLAEPVVMETHP